MSGQIHMLVTVVAAGWFTSAAPSVKETVLAKPGLSRETCADTTGEHVCLQLQFAFDPDTRESAFEGRETRGVVHYALYRGGEVGLFGPGDSERLYKGKVEADVQKRTVAFLELPNVPAQRYQILAFFDVNNNGRADSGEAVTFPSDSFALHKNTRASVNVRFDYIRP